MGKSFCFLFFLIFGKCECALLKPGHFLYYAYGSNLLMKRLHINNPTAKYYANARLDDYRLDFAMQHPEWRGAVATVVPEEGSHVWGTLWTLASDRIVDLDKQEQVSSGMYYRKNVTVVLPNGSREQALLYKETKDPTLIPAGEIWPENRLPSITYKQVIILGAKEFGLPDDYIRYLEAFPDNRKCATDKMRELLGSPFTDCAENK